VTRAAGRGRLAAAAAVLGYAGIAAAVGIRRGGDLDAHFPLAARWLAHAPVYTAAPHLGAWWPPFAVLVVTPFAGLAAHHAAAAKAAWALLQVACLAWVLLRAPRPPLSPVLLALAAVAVPLHRNFEDLNMNGFLLGLATAAARDLDAGHERRAGAWVGAAAALKLFPGLLLLYLAYRRRWRGVLTGAAVAVALSAAPLAPYGATGALHEARAWLAASAAGVWGVRGSNQSLAALVARLHAPAAAVLACDLAAVALALVALRRPTSREGACGEIGAVLLVAVLVSPIAWVHYFLLAFPAWLTVLRRTAARRPPRGWIAALGASGIATSGVLTVGSLSLRREVWELSTYTWGAVLLLAALAFLPAGRAQETQGAQGTQGTQGTPA
jgi:alpha-1,2-mannosyltransferase